PASTPPALCPPITSTSSERAARRKPPRRPSSIASIPPRRPDEIAVRCFSGLSDHLQYKLSFSPILHAEKAAPHVEAVLFLAWGNGDARSDKAARGPRA